MWWGRTVGGREGGRASLYEELHEERNRMERNGRVRLGYEKRGFGEDVLVRKGGGKGGALRLERESMFREARRKARRSGIGIGDGGGRSVLLCLSNNIVVNARQRLLHCLKLLPPAPVDPPRSLDPSGILASGWHQSYVWLYLS